MKKEPWFLLCAIAMLPWGCATVNPEADYDRLAEHVAVATGAREVYRPGADEATRAHVLELLDGGLTSDEAVQIVLLNNPRLQAAFYKIGMAHADVVQSKLFSNPSLFSSVRLPDGGGLANVELAFAQNIADLWLISARRRTAARGLEQVILDLARQASVLAAETKTTYCRAISADRVLEIAQENRELAQRLLDSTIGRQQAGAGNQVDVNLSRSEFMETELAVRSAKLAAFEERRSLATLLGLRTPPDELKLVDALPDVPAWTITQEALVTIAERRRLDLQAADRTIDAAHARFVQEKRKVFQSVELGVSMERADRAPGSDGNLLAETARSSFEAGQFALPPLGRRDDNDQDTLIGPSINLELPIFDRNQAQIAKAQYAYEEAVRLRESVLLEVIQEVRSAYQRAKTAWEVSSFFRDSLLPLREDNLELSRDAYRTGTVPFLSVLETQRALLLARSKYVEAVRDAAIGFADIEKATGLPIKTILEIDYGAASREVTP